MVVTTDEISRYIEKALRDRGARLRAEVNLTEDRAILLFDLPPEDHALAVEITTHRLTPRKDSPTD